MLRFSLFAKYPWIVHGAFSKTLGNIDSRFSSSKDVANNLSKAAKQLSLPQQLIVQARQIHGTKIAVIDSKAKAKKYISSSAAGVDGFLTNQANILLMIKTADCIPLFMVDPKHKLVGLMHVGLSGASKNIHIKALTTIKQVFRSQAKDVLIGMGPSICSNCYKFETQPPRLSLAKWGKFVSKSNHLWKVDISGYVENSLIAAGIKRSNIEKIDICSFENPNWFSHRRQLQTGEPAGRSANIIGIRK